MNKLKATIRTARMSDEQLLKYGFSQADIDAGKHLPTVGGGTNSTAVITDLGTVASNINATQRGRAIAAAGPILDLDAAVALMLLRMQEVKALATYLLYGGETTTSNPGGQGGSQAILQTGEQSCTTLITIWNILA